MARFIPQYVAMDDAITAVSKRVGAAINGEHSLPAALDAAKRDLEELLRQFPQPQS